jgi:serine/threonine-protein kinase
VLGSGATARYRDPRDPRAIGVDLGAALLVDATLQATPKQWRVQVRLVEVPSGLQLWSDRFEAAADDPLAAQDILSKRIAEALRIELMTIAHRGGAPQEAIALYLRARRKIAGAHIIGTDGAVELLEECLRLAPNFRPALASHAIACARARFFVATGAAEPRDWVTTTEAAVARAVEAAPDLPETHLARGMLAVQDGHWREAVRAFLLALEFAPFYAQAHEYLAQLQCEAGNIEEGVARARLTAALDPSMLIALNHVARIHALRGDREAWARTMAPLAAQPHFQFIGLVIEARVSGWFGDTERLRDILRRVDSLALGGRARAVVLIARAFLREYTRDELLAGSELLLANSPSPRLFTTTCQIACEACAANDLRDEALDFLERAAASRLIDLDWLDHCPPLAPLRQHPRFLKVRREISARCETMWIL